MPLSGVKIGAVSSGHPCLLAEHMKEALAEGQETSPPLFFCHQLVRQMHLQLKSLLEIKQDLK